jgi:hypothetical protein
MSSICPDRRTFLRSAAALVVIALTPFRGLYASNSLKPRPIPPPFLALFKDSDAPAKIGQHYLSVFPQEADPEWLRSRVLPCDACSLDELRDHLQGAIRSDFRTRRIARINGWVISRTEGRLCALFHITGAVTS